MFNYFKIFFDVSSCYFKCGEKESALSARSSIPGYKFKDNYILETTTNFVDYVRPIYNNPASLEQHKYQALCLRKISYGVNFTESHIQGNLYLSLLYLSIFRITGEILTILLVPSHI